MPIPITGLFEPSGGADAFDLVSWHDVANHNWAGDGFPSAGNDTTEGYVSGSIWIDITDWPTPVVYVCSDATEGAAVWGALLTTTSHLALGDNTPHHGESHDHSQVASGQILQPLHYKWPAPTVLTIAAGEITVTRSHHEINTQGGAASDDLDTINGLTLRQWYLLRPEQGDHTVVFKHGTGNLLCIGNADINLDDDQDFVLVYAATPASAYVLGGGVAGGGAMATDPLWDAAGDLAVGTGADTGGRLARTVPSAANLLNVLGLANGDTTPAWKVLFDGTAPEPIGVAAAGTGVVAAHRNHIHSNTVVLPWLFEGVCSVRKHPKIFRLPFAMTYSDIKLMVPDGDEPTGASLKVDIKTSTDKVTWTTIFSTLPEIDAAAEEEDNNQVTSDTSYAANDYIRAEITQIGSTIAGLNLGVDLICTR